jgi:hypothetical protein
MMSKSIRRPTSIRRIRFVRYPPSLYKQRDTLPTALYAPVVRTGTGNTVRSSHEGLIAMCS